VHAPPAVAAGTSVQDGQPEAPEDLPLAIRIQVDPKFSPAMLARLGKGRVEVHFEVAPDGSVSQATVTDSSHARLNGPVLHAVAQWKFEPLQHAQPGAAVLAFDVEQP
jgi:TonB family protein